MLVVLASIAVVQASASCRAFRPPPDQAHESQRGGPPFNAGEGRRVTLCVCERVCVCVCECVVEGVEGGVLYSLPCV